jgi:outer membrane protein OmpA-like peptidoglycan-associated protein
MADSTKDPQRRPTATGGGIAVADDGDVAFGGMAGAGILAAILVAFFISAGIIGYTPEPTNEGGPQGSEAGDDDHSDDDGDHSDQETSLEADGFQISADLAAGGFPPVQLSATGNAVTVRGPVADEATRTRIIEFISQQPNVETVVDEMFIPEPDEVTAAAVIDVADDNITLSGTVPSEEMAAGIRAAASDAYSPDQIADGLVVFEGATTYMVTSSGSMSDPIRYGSLTEALAAASKTSGAIEGTYTGAVELDAEVDASLNELVALEPILFQIGTAVIDAASQPTLDQAIEILKLFPDSSVEIGGHTDSTGDPAFNSDLSQRRAQAVLDALVAGGVETELTAVGYGPDRPVGDNATPEGRQQNRRIEFEAK